jgi:hypothetical protein
MNKDYEPLITGKAIGWGVFWITVAITPFFG